MNKEVQAFLNEAQKALQAGHLMLSGGLPEKAVSQAYFAMFWAARAMVLAEGEKCSSHRELTGTFGRLFAKGARVDRKFHRYLTDALDRRHVADYDAEPIAPITKLEADETLKKADEFVQMAEAFLKAQEV